MTTRSERAWNFQTLGTWPSALALTVTVLCWSNIASQAQLYVRFANASNEVYDPWVQPGNYDRAVRFDATAIGVNPFGTNLAPVVSNLVPGLRAQLYCGASTNTEHELRSVTNAPTTFRSSSSVFPGCWYYAIVHANVFAPFDGVYVGPVHFQVRVWDISRAATYEDALSDPDYDGLLGKSAMFAQSWYWQENAFKLHELRSFTIGYPGLAPRLITDDGMLGFRSNQFGFNVYSRSGRVVVIERSVDRLNWVPSATNLMGGAPFYYSDPTSAEHPVRYYRAFVK